MLETRHMRVSICPEPFRRVMLNQLQKAANGIMKNKVDFPYTAM